MTTKDELINAIQECHLDVQFDDDRIKSCYYTYLNQNPNKCIKIRVSDHLPYLNTWVAYLNKSHNDILLDKSTNICIIFTHDMFNATRVRKKHKSFSKSKYVAKIKNGFANSFMPKFVVRCFVYDCNTLSKDDVTLILNKMKVILDNGYPYTDIFYDDSKRRAIQFSITSSVSKNEQIIGSSEEGVNVQNYYI